MVAAHMDELARDRQPHRSPGYARFANLGTLLLGRARRARALRKRRDRHIGVKTSSPSAANCRNFDGFFIDISQDANGNAPIQVGDPGAFVREVVWRGERVIGKALDDRLGCAVQIEAMRRLKEQGTPHTVYFVFTVQEEVGSRGARPAGYGLDPHIAFALDLSPAGDVPKPKELGINLGGGAVIKVRDSATSSRRRSKPDDPAGRRARHSLPTRSDDAGTTDGRRFSSRGPVPTGAVRIPARYVHTQSETADRRDIHATIDLLVGILSSLSALAAGGAQPAGCALIPPIPRRARRLHRYRPACRWRRPDGLHDPS